ncbi:MAG: hypothetical protein ACFCGT_26335 [Sandaracinaceae bacterium]
MIRRATCALTLALAGHAMLPGPVLAQRCETDEEVRRRLALVEAAVVDHEPSARRWWSSMTLLQGAIVVGASVLTVAADGEPLRNSLLVAAGGAGLGMLSLLLAVPPLMGGSGTLRSMPVSTPEERLAKLKVAESIMRRDASSAERFRGPLVAGYTAAYLFAASLIHLLAFDRASSAYIQAAGGVVVGFGRVLLRPTDSRTFWRRYTTTEGGACFPAQARRPEVRVAGLGVLVQF